VRGTKERSFSGKFTGDGAGKTEPASSGWKREAAASRDLETPLLVDLADLLYCGIAEIFCLNTILLRTLKNLLYLCMSQLV
jgi:hypothetical protein